VTLNYLRKLADEATPGPWFNEPNTAAGRVWIRAGNMDAEPLFNFRSHASDFTEEQKRKKYAQREKDARLAALAPDLARLCAELGEALEEITDYSERLHGGDERLTPESYHIARDTARLALDKLEDLTESGAVELTTPRLPAPDLPTGGKE
jgi:hypothetical protein